MQANLARLAESAGERQGDHRSLWFDGVWHTNSSLLDRASRVATGLRGIGVGPGDRVVMLMANCPEVSILYNAIWRAGAVVTPVVFLVSALDLRHVVMDSGAAAVMTTPELLSKVIEALDGHPVPVVVVGAADGGFGMDFAQLESAAAGSIVNRADDDLAALLYTGGTTGRSKGVELTHANLFSSGGASRRNSTIPGLTRAIIGLPLSHAYGILVTVSGMHATEPLSTVLLRWFDPELYLRLAAEHRVQVTAVVPSMIVMLLGLPLEAYDLGELRYVFSGAAPLAPSVAQEFQRRVPSATVLEGYGCTESGGIISGTPPDAPRPGTVGKPVQGVQVRIVGLDGGDAPAGTDGEIVVRGPNVMHRYWGGERLGDGWFHTGDIGRLDEDGYLTVVDRMKDLIIRGGFNVYPRDVEDVLLKHPAVAMAAVVGRPDERLGEEVVAFVSLVDGATATPEELVEFCKERLSGTKYPREVTVLDAIPLTSVGKLDRKRLRQAAA